MTCDVDRKSSWKLGSMTIGIRDSGVETHYEGAQWAYSLGL